MFRLFCSVFMLLLELGSVCRVVSRFLVELVLFIVMFWLIVVISCVCDLYRFLRVWWLFGFSFSVC